MSKNLPDTITDRVLSHMFALFGLLFVYFSIQDSSLMTLAIGIVLSIFAVVFRYGE